MLLISTSSLKWYWLHKIFKLISKSTLDWINLDIVAWEFDTEDALYIKSLSEEFNVPVVSVSAYEKKMDAKLVDALIDFCRIIWAKMINFYPPHRADKDTTWFSDYLAKAQIKTPDILLSVMNVEPKTFLFFIPEYKDATLETIKKITKNTSLAISNVDITTWVDLLKTFNLLWNTIRNVFLSDKSWAKSELMLGKWDMPLRDLLWKLKENSYNWLFTLKIAPKDLLVGSPDEIVLWKIEDAQKYFNKYYVV